jgi:hypothetical protein
MLSAARGDIPKVLDLVPPSLEKAGVKKTKYQETTTKKKR